MSGRVESYHAEAAGEERAAEIDKAGASAAPSVDNEHAGAAITP